MKWIPIILLTAAGGWAGWWLGAPRANPAGPDIAGKPPVSAGDQVHAQPLLKQETTDPLSLLALPESEYPARLRRAFQQGWHGEMGWLARRWAARDPAGLFAFMTAPEGLALSGSPWRDWAVTEACFEAWFQKDLPAALAAMETLRQYDPAEGKMGYHGWHAILPKLILFDPARGVQFLGDHPDYGDSILLDFNQLRGLAEVTPTLPECAARPGFLRRVFHAFARNPDRTKGMADGLAWLAKFPPAVRLEALPQLLDVEPEDLPTVREMIRRSFSLEDLTAAATATNVVIQNDNRLKNVALIRAMLDPADAMAWATNSLDGAARQQAMEQILASSLPDKLEDAGPFLENLPPGPLYDQTLHRVLQRCWETQGHRAAADWIATLPEPETRQTSLTSLSGNWARQRPAEFLEWFGHLPEGTPRAQLAVAALDGVYDIAAKVDLAGKLPEAMGVEALELSWSGQSRDSRPIAEAAARQPAGLLRESAMAKASHDSGLYFRGFNQKWLDWASNLPTAADRAAALRGAERSTVIWPKWAEGIEEAARAKLK